MKVFSGFHCWKPLAWTAAVLSLSALTAGGVPANGAGRGKKSAPPSRTEAETMPEVSEKILGLDRREGFLTIHLDRAKGKLWLELPPPIAADGEILQLIYVEGLASGLGSNPVGLDRGQMAESKLLRIRRLGPKVLFEEPNQRYRALSEDRDERRAAAQSFATSVIWGQEIGALDTDGRSLVDFTSFVVRDAHGVTRKLQEAEQGSFTLDPMRSTVDPERCLAFPDNVELEAILTFASDEPGAEVKATAPTPTAVTLVQHHSLVRLPDDDYRPRRFDPRIGIGAVEFRDVAAALGESPDRRWLMRHRLRKAEPEARLSPAVEPLIYYVDRGIPEPVRSAVLDGARWWAAAFEAAGFADAFQVELMPAGADFLDARYNVVQWVHRATRGWSYGGGVVDPRSGEILKGHVILGSLRVRQDRLLFEGLAGTDKTGTGAADDPIQLALARIRQLAAHEVGHSLGIGHNFAASTYGGRASVMDYPAPLVTVAADGELDFSAAYAVGVGAWDVHTIRYGYADLGSGAYEAAALDKIVRQGLAKGLLFLTDEDARPPGASEPRANLWDNGDDPVAALETALSVRRTALQRFGERQVLPGTPLAELEEVLAPVYFHHRYQLAAAVKTIGGMEYNYAVRGDRQWATRIVSGDRQRRALAVVLGILSPAELDIPESVLELLAPRPFEYPRHREMFESSTAPVFDALGAARTAADQVLQALLQPQRLGRLSDFHRRDPSLPDVAEILEAVTAVVFAEAAGESLRHAALRQVSQRAAIDRIIALAADAEVRPRLRADLEQALRRIGSRFTASGADDRAAHEAALAADIERFLDRGQGSAATVTGPPAGLPPGGPIGSLPELAACSWMG
ncbi:MAG: zinc-dependent metalloprotease [Thermoanaerobaculia bacterium]